MSTSTHRVAGLVKKEFIHFYRDPVVAGLIFYHFFVCIILCAYSLLFEADHLQLVVYDMSRTEESRELANRFLTTEYFDLDRYANSMEEVRQRFDESGARGALIIPAEFSRELEKGRRTDVQYITDGTNANQSGQGVGYANAIVADFNRKVTLEHLNRAGTPVASLPGIANEVRPIYNQGLREVDFSVVAHIMVAGVIGGLLLSGTAVVREKERGTIDQLLVTPTSSFELLLAKGLTPLMICLIATVFSFLVVVWFGVPLRGSVPVFFAFMTIFLISMIGIGILIGSVCNNTLQVVLLSYVVWFPAVFLPGVATPVENMLPFMQGISSVFPTTPFLVAANGIFQKGLGFFDLWSEALRLIVTGVILFSLGAWITRRQWKQ